MGEERIFVPRTTKRRRGFSTSGPDASWEDYAWAYLRAARELNKMRAEGSIDALPIVFLYRHAAELSIKSALIEFGKPAGIDTKKLPLRKHNLVDQLPDLARLCVYCHVELDAAIEKWIDRWQRADSGMSGRYPVTWEGMRHGLADMVRADNSFDLPYFVSIAESVLTEIWDLIGEIENFMAEQETRALLDDGVIGTEELGLEE